MHVVCCTWPCRCTPRRQRPPAKTIPPRKSAGVKGLEKRIQQLEQAIGREAESDKWYDRIQISGLIEVKADYRDFEDNGTTELTDLVGGWSAFVTFSFLERFKLVGETVGALDDFEAGEI